MPKRKIYKQKTRKEYSKIGEVNCPAFPDEKIAYNAKGFNHIFYKGSRSEKGYKDIKTRLRLLSRSRELLKKSAVYQEEDWYYSKYKGKKKRIKFWVFEGVMEKRRIVVVVRQIGKGKKHFWSVIPGWRRSRFGRVKNYRKSPRKY